MAAAQWGVREYERVHERLTSASSGLLSVGIYLSYCFLDTPTQKARYYFFFELLSQSNTNTLEAWNASRFPQGVTTNFSAVTESCDILGIHKTSMSSLTRQKHCCNRCEQNQRSVENGGWLSPSTSRPLSVTISIETDACSPGAARFIHSLPSN